MTTDKTTILSRQRGMLPDRYWYQLNGKSAAENYADQKLPTEEDGEELILTSEVKIK